MRYQVDFYDYSNGATSPIDTIEAPEGYTAADYINDCKGNADDAWNEMLAGGKVELVKIED